MYVFYTPLRHVATFLNENVLLKYFWYITWYLQQIVFTYVTVVEYIYNSKRKDLHPNLKQICTKYIFCVRPTKQIYVYDFLNICMEKKMYENLQIFVKKCKDIWIKIQKDCMKIQKYLQTNGVYMRASGITLVSGPLVTITPQYTPIAPTTAKDGRGDFHTYKRTR